MWICARPLTSGSQHFRQQRRGGLCLFNPDIRLQQFDKRFHLIDRQTGIHGRAQMIAKLTARAPARWR